MAINTSLEYIHNQFARQAELSPDAIAVTCQGQQLTYRQLNERANQVAHFLLEKGLAHGELVGLSLDRSLDMVAGLYGILKAGGAYVPLDPDYPKERLATMVKSADLKMIVTQNKYAEGFSEVVTVCMDSDDSAISKLNRANPETKPTPDDLIYVIFTSGSTGDPKGAAVYHRGFSNLVNWYAEEFSIDSEEQVLLVSSLSFDLTQKNLYAPLVRGGTLHVNAPGPYDITKLRNLIGAQGITLINCTPSTFYPLIDGASDAVLKQLQSLRVVCLGGEPISIPRLREWLMYPTTRAEVANSYGPTECTDVCAFYRMNRENMDQYDFVPLGGPISNVELTVIDDNGKPCEEGEPGELCIAGVGLGAGYINSPEMTKERFVSHQIPGISDPVIYRTGDQARYLEDGVLEFLGRLDHQTKIRGFRIELHEIENVLNENAGIQEAIVVAWKGEHGDQDPRLVAFYTSQGDEEVSVNELRDFVKNSLPDYMMPGEFHSLVEYPLSPNGKVDRKKLLERLNGENRVKASLPKTSGSAEDRVRNIWADVLNDQNMGRADNFFDLGGNSIQFAQVHVRLQEESGNEFPITELFDYPTIKAMGTFLEGTANLDSPSNETVSSEVDATESIAIIGMSGRFPGAANIEQFWDNLTNGVESVSRFEVEELESSVATEEALASGQTFSRSRSVLKDVDQFDAEFFGIYPKEAELMDPQHRLFLECAWESLESAGWDPESYPGAIGVYAGLSLNTYLLYNVGAGRELARNYQVGEYQTMMGNDKDFMPTRVSYKLNLKGPSMAVQSACSTSLVAISQACSSLLNRESDMALAGGVSISFPQKRDYLYTEEGMVSGDGTCRTFDADANGTVFGHGVAVVLLKRLSDAIADGDPIHAVIKGSAINNDGSDKVGYAAPSVSAQADVIAKAQAAAKVDPESISYVEAHGTGTPLGDPIEVAALTKAFRSRGSNNNGYCAIGTGKTHIGHIDVAAGATGLIKTVMQLKKGLIPPLLHFKTPNPKIDFANSPFYPASETIEWKSNGAPRRAGVSAFGVGGTNAHVVLEEAPELEPSGESRDAQLLLLSAKSDTALDEMTSNLANHLEANSDSNLADVAFTLQTGRRGFEVRRMIVAQDQNDAVEKLRSGDNLTIFSGKAAEKEPKVVFLFPGQGAQYVGMGRELYDSDEVFREAVDSCSRILEPLLDLDIREVLYPGEANLEKAEHDIHETWITQPCIFVTEYALARLWISWGVNPSVVIGHSIGEYVAAVLAETFTLEDALALLATRGKLMQDLPGGSMLSVRLGVDELEPLLPDNVTIAALNSPKLSVVSGPTEALEAFQKELEAKNIVARILRTSHAFHSPMMDPILSEFTEAAKKTDRKAPQIPWVSTATGDWMTGRDMEDPSYWANQLRHSVRFADAIEKVITDEEHVLLEVGPGQTLSQLAKQHAAKAKGLAVLGSLGPNGEPGSDLESILGAMGRLWIAGKTPDWTSFYANETRRKVTLPTYPFQRKSYWIEPESTVKTTSVIDVKSPAHQAPVFDSIISSPCTAPEVEVAQPIASGSRRDRVAQNLCNLFEDLSGSEQSDEDSSVSFMELGYDSLFLTQVSQRIQSEFGERIAFRQLMGDLGSLDRLADYLDEKLPADALPEPVAMAAPTTSIAPMTGVPQNGDVIGTMLHQMQSMTQQLEHLRQTGVVSGTHSSRPRISAVKVEEEGNDRFGPFKGIDKGPSGGLTSVQQKALDELVDRYTKRTAQSKSQAQEHRAYFCDPRAAGNFRQLWKEMVYPIVCAKSKGSRIWDIDGNEYIDVTMGFGTHYLGHSPDYVMEAIDNQLKAGVEIGPQSPVAGEVARMLCEFTGMERATFCNTGSEAVMAAIRVARTVSARDKVVYFRGDYHGIFDEVLGRPANVDGKPGAMPIAPGIPHLADVIVLEYDSPESIEKIAEYADEIAVVIVEPIQSRHPDLQPREFLHELRKVTEENEIALVFDEVITGFRLAQGGAQEYFGVKADLATYGKVVGGGMPIGALAGKAKYMDALDGGFWEYGDDSFPPTGVTFFAGTFVRHPLAMAAAHAVMTFIGESGPELQVEANRRTAKFVDGMNTYFEEIEMPIRFQTFSTLFYYDFHPDLQYANLLFYYLRDKGIHIWEGRVGNLSIAHSDEDLARVAEAFKESIEEMQAAGFLPTKGKSPNDRFPLTEGQKEMWLATQFDPAASVTQVGSNAIHLEGDLDIENLEKAIREAVKRHDGLHGTFDSDGSEIILQRQTDFEIPFHDFSELDSPERDTRVEEFLTQEGARKFDLENGPLYTFQILKVSEKKHLLVFSVQMIICDGWGYNLVLEDISAIYSGLITGEKPALEPRQQMHEYVRWQEEQAETGEATETEAFWLKQFEDPPPPLELPTSRVRPPKRSFEGSRETLRFSEEFHEEIKAAAKRMGATPFALLLTAYQVWLHRLSGEEDVVVGIPFAGQSGSGMEALSGQCVHTLPLRSKPKSEVAFQDLLNETKESLFDIQDNWNYSFGKLVQKLDLPRDPGRIPLVSVIFNVDPPLSGVKFTGCTERIEAAPRSFFQYDLGFNLVDEGGPLVVECDYNSILFDAATIGEWLRGYESLLKGSISDPNGPIAALPMLSDDGIQKVIRELNSTTQSYLQKAIHDLVAEQADLNPEAVAVAFDDTEMTYRELEIRSNQLANFLRGLEVDRNVPVGVCLERTSDMVVGILGIVKAGGCFVPLDPDSPRDRIGSILENASASLILTESSLLPNLPETKIGIVCLDDDWNVISDELRDAPEIDSQLDDLAYITYTSGSTGTPNGVEVSHRALVNCLDFFRIETGIKNGDTMPALANLTFDISILEIFMPLISGARVLMVARSTAIDPDALAVEIQRHKVTIAQATPSTWRMLKESGWQGDPDLKVLCGGEELRPGLANWLTGICGKVWNVYGPTETTIWSTCCEVKPEDEIVSLGKPIANTRIYLVDEQLQPVPVGVAGELVIGGDGLAHGYHANPALTGEKFIGDPFSETKADRLFRTGDLARFLPTGQLEFLGRRDLQVKIRGFRVELGEIESVLMNHADVREAAVLAIDEQLVAYVEATREDIDSELRDSLRGKLPEVMQPSAIVTLDRFPRTVRGKIDRGNLPIPGEEHFVFAEHYVEPRNETEEGLVRIWSETLKLEKIGVQSSFFDLGGQSLQAVSLFAKIERDFGKKLPLATLFRSPTIEQLARELSGEGSEAGAWRSLVHIQTKGDKPPLFLVHGAGGNVLLYRSLAQSMAPDFPLYGLQAQGLDAESEPLHSIEEMAALYIAEIRDVQPEGPYYLGGYCMGGTIAYEIAQRLRDEGQKVSLLALLDTYEWTQMQKASSLGMVRQKLGFHIKNLTKLKIKESPGYIADKLQVAKDGEMSALLKSVRDGIGVREKKSSSQSVELKVQDANDEAAEAYLPKPYSGKVTLVKPKVNYDHYPDPKMGWGDLAVGGLDIVELPVNPHAMLADPYVELLAAALQERIESELEVDRAADSSEPSKAALHS